MTAAPGQTRPMTPADYQPGDPGAPVSPDHPMRDLVLAAFVGAAALWLVPKVLDSTVGTWLGDRADEPEEYDLEYEG